MTEASADTAQQRSVRHEKGGCQPASAVTLGRPGGREEMIRQVFKR